MCIVNQLLFIFDWGRDGGVFIWKQVPKGPKDDSVLFSDFLGGLLLEVLVALDGSYILHKIPACLSPSLPPS